MFWKKRKVMEKPMVEENRECGKEGLQNTVFSSHYQISEELINQLREAKLECMRDKK